MFHSTKSSYPSPRAKALTQVVRDKEFLTNSSLNLDSISSSPAYNSDEYYNTIQSFQDSSSSLSYGDIHQRFSSLLAENQSMKLSLQQSLFINSSLQSENESLNHHLEAAKEALNESKRSLTKVQHATDILIKKRDDREEQLSKVINISQVYEKRISELEATGGPMASSLKLLLQERDFSLSRLEQTNFKNLQEVITLKDEVGQLKSENEVLTNKIQNLLTNNKELESKISFKEEGFEIKMKELIENKSKVINLEDELDIKNKKITELMSLVSNLEVKLIQKTSEKEEIERKLKECQIQDEMNKEIALKGREQNILEKEALLREREERLNEKENTNHSYSYPTTVSTVSPPLSQSYEDSHMDYTQSPIFINKHGGREGHSNPFSKIISPNSPRLAHLKPFYNDNDDIGPDYDEERENLNEKEDILKGVKKLLEDKINHFDSGRELIYERMVKLESLITSTLTSTASAHIVPASPIVSNKSYDEEKQILKDPETELKISLLEMALEAQKEKVDLIEKLSLTTLQSLENNTYESNNNNKNTKNIETEVAFSIVERDAMQAKVNFLEELIDKIMKTNQEQFNEQELKHKKMQQDWQDKLNSETYKLQMQLQNELINQQNILNQKIESENIKLKEFHKNQLNEKIASTLTLSEFSTHFPPYSIAPSQQLSNFSLSQNESLQPPSLAPSVVVPLSPKKDLDLYSSDSDASEVRLKRRLTGYRSENKEEMSDSSDSSEDEEPPVQNLINIVAKPTSKRDLREDSPVLSIKKTNSKIEHEKKSRKDKEIQDDFDINESISKKSFNISNSNFNNMESDAEFSSSSKSQLKELKEEINKSIAVHRKYKKILSKFVDNFKEKNGREPTKEERKKANPREIVEYSRLSNIIKVKMAQYESLQKEKKKI